MSVAQISAPELKQLLERRGSDILLLDVREDDEVAFCTLPGSLHIPMNLLPLRHNELPDDKTIVVYCHHGVRSLNCAMFLEHAGFETLYNLQGGIDAWSKTVDAAVPRY